MSTDLQQYSTENQLDKIKRYADQRGLEIVRVFEDAGRSGLTLTDRDGLQDLMRVVQSGTANFEAILVYDVSRWGRFQDADEGAYHEHLCSRAGIRVHYCGEQFDNDGSIGSILLKNVKRVMAGEYSRELSVKVFAGQCRLVELGFRQGGPAGYGLRRQLIDERRQPKAELRRGERKSLQTDRVVLGLGPQDEIDHVRRIYTMFVDDGLSEQEIASRLNNEGILTDFDRKWSRSSVHQILTNEKYIGNNVFNRVSFKLKQKRIVNNRESWVRAEGVYPSIIERALFDRARSIIDARSNHYSDEELLSFLRTILQEEGSLSGLVIDERSDMPSSSAYRYRFGSFNPGIQPDRLRARSRLPLHRDKSKYTGSLSGGVGQYCRRIRGGWRRCYARRTHSASNNKRRVYSGHRNRPCIDHNERISSLAHSAGYRPHSRLDRGGSPRWLEFKAFGLLRVPWP